MKTVCITIGRDNDGHPLESADWQSFRFAVAGAILQCGGDILFRPPADAKKTGEGVWRGRVSEEAAAFVAFVPDTQVNRLAEKLQVHARHHGQEAIGFVVADGTENLIFADETAAA